MKSEIFCESWSLAISLFRPIWNSMTGTTGRRVSKLFFLKRVSLLFADLVSSLVCAFDCVNQPALIRNDFHLQHSYVHSKNASRIFHDCSVFWVNVWFMYCYESPVLSAHSIKKIVYVWGWIILCTLQYFSIQLRMGCQNQKVLKIWN